MNTFASRIIRWQRRHGRHALPWQAAADGSRDPYRVWLSEIMLQQTQVATVIPYFERFVARFPDLAALAFAAEDEVLALWSGLGYYSRARNLHAAARAVVERHGGKLPGDAAALAQLPGIGRSTAAAIAALGFGRRGAILDGNVRRVLARHAGVAGWPGERSVETALWALAEARLPDTDIEAYTQGMMDLGATLCTRSRPRCADCPVRDDCVAHREHRTAELPTPRPKKTLPEKQVQMLLLLDRGEVLLEKRPPRGIWGGLWSLPEVAAEADAASHCRTHFGFAVRSQQPLAPLSHSFTHFRLHIRPVRLQVASRRDATPGRLWLPLADARGAALPAPVRTLLDRLEECVA
ncbi:MAG: A/G-specific adenine glycosylase [Pseudomonadota bacterium]